jgi:outer membrane protein assembly factor BamB
MVHYIITDTYLPSALDYGSVAKSARPNMVQPGVAILWMLIFSLSLAVTRAEDWPGWRGPRGDGTSLETNVPMHWTSSSNVVWRTEIPGQGHASPIVVSNQVFTVSALINTEERMLLALDRANGKMLWTKTVLRMPMERKHPLNSYASSTPASDGQKIYVAFLDGAEMFVAAYDFEGHQKWAVHPGPFSSMHGFCSSPIVYQDKVIVNGDHDGASYLMALSREDGRTLWKTPRAHHTRSYCAPLIREMDDRTQMVLSGDKSVASYDPDNGALRWIIDGPTEQFVASPVYSAKEHLLYITGGFPDHHILAINPSGSGNVTLTHIVWRTNRGAAYVPSPIVAGDYFLVVSDSGVAYCFRARSGEVAWQERLGSHHASLASAAGLVYFLSDDGVTTVVKPSERYQEVASNPIGEPCFASPAISDGHIFLRGDRGLFCIGTPR